MSPHNELLADALGRKTESSTLDFKSGFNPASAGDWLEIIKDVVAFANSGGGIILIGLGDDGTPTGADVSGITGTDPADLTNQIHKYTGQHFAAFELAGCSKEGSELCAICIGAPRVPIVFTRVGTYETNPGKQKTVFSVGTVYFRHGAKSEPGTSDDLRAFLERELEVIRKSWLEGIASVVEAPPGSRFAVLPPEGTPAGPAGVLPMRLTNDPSAQPYYAVPIDSTHPYRQKELVKAVNAQLAGRRTINSHDILCIRRVHSIQKEIAFCYTQNFASPRYSEQFVDWIVSRYNQDPAFFEKAKAEFDVIKRASE